MNRIQLTNNLCIGKCLAFLLASALSLFSQTSYAVSEASIKAVQQAYVSYYGRPGDKAGVEWWAQKLDENGGDFAEIINQFGESAEYRERFGSLTTKELVDNLYTQMFGRTSEEAGLAYWAERIDSGELTLGNVALEIAYGAQNDDLVTLSKRVDISTQITNFIDQFEKAYGTESINLIRDNLMKITANTDVQTFVTDVVINTVIPALSTVEEDNQNSGGDHSNGTANALGIIEQGSGECTGYDSWWVGPRYMELANASLTDSSENVVIKMERTAISDDELALTFAVQTISNVVYPLSSDFSAGFIYTMNADHSFTYKIENGVKYLARAEEISTGVEVEPTDTIPTQYHQAFELVQKSIQQAGAIKTVTEATIPAYDWPKQFCKGMVWRSAKTENHTFTTITINGADRTTETNTHTGGETYTVLMLDELVTVPAGQFSTIKFRITANNDGANYRYAWKTAQNLIVKEEHYDSDDHLIQKTELQRIEY